MKYNEVCGLINSNFFRILLWIIIIEINRQVQETILKQKFNIFNDNKMKI